MTFAYADPPYIGCAHMYPEKQEVDHAELIERLCNDYADGWALSCHSPSLKLLLPLCPADVRVMAWVKPFAVYKDRNVAYAWEPLLVRGGRRRPKTVETAKDWVMANIVLKGGVMGSKPPAFCLWLFNVLGMQPEDDFHDLFPGSGAVSRAWEQHREAMRWRDGSDQFELCLTGDGS